jgi:uncharacterized protein YegP (UPF0339 family)
MAGKFELYTDVAGKFRFRLKAANGQIIAVGEAYESKTSALAGIESIKHNAPVAEVIDLSAAKPGAPKPAKSAVPKPAATGPAPTKTATPKTAMPKAAGSPTGTPATAPAMPTNGTPGLTMPAT